MCIFDSQACCSRHMELGTLALTRPSLNIVRDAEGDWNLADWLPHSSVAGVSGGAAPGLPTPLFFEESKCMAAGSTSSTATTNCRSVSSMSPVQWIRCKIGKVRGLWQIDLQATPWRYPPTFCSKPGDDPHGRAGRRNFVAPASRGIDFRGPTLPHPTFSGWRKVMTTAFAETMNLAFAARTEGNRGRCKVEPNCGKFIDGISRCGRITPR